MIPHNESEQLIGELFETLLQRRPNSHEVEGWRLALSKESQSVLKLFNALLKSDEVKKRRGVKTTYPAGHYYSPVVDPSLVKKYVEAQRKLQHFEVAGIPLEPERMLRFWKENLHIIQATTFKDEPSPPTRFHYVNGSYPYGDAIMLRTILAYYKPKRIAEIGSGYTTACMLDTADSENLRDLRITCIEPYADRLRSLLRPSDWHRVTLIEKPVQDVPVSTFVDLRENDILFIDSTHILKTGSDVHFEVFKILPKLSPGVIVHFHDIPFPFEYPNEWIFSENYSWNEAYFLQAFLMYNEKFKVIMWNSLLARYYSEKIKSDFPLFLQNPGSSIWLKSFM